MWILLFVMHGMTPEYLGDYSDQSLCKNAIREIFSIRTNPPNQRLKELESAIDIQVRESKQFLCVKKN